MQSIPPDPTVKVPREFSELAKLDPKKVKNIYDKGFLRNLWSVIYPPSSRPSSTTPARSRAGTKKNK